MMSKQMTDVLEYLYKEGKKELADVVLLEMNRKPKVEIIPCNLPHCTHANLRPPYKVGDYPPYWNGVI